MFLPVRIGSKRYVWPTATLALIVCNLLMFIAQQFMAPSFQGVMALRADRLDPLAWLSSMFMHADLLHLGVNMVFVWTFGLYVEARFCWWRMLLLYGASGVGAGLVFQAVHWGEPAAAIGASGAIAGLMGICVVVAPLGKVHILPLNPIVMLAASAQGRRPTFFIPLLGWVMLWVFSQVMFSMFDIGGVAYAAHFGGIGTGIILGMILRAGVLDAPDPDEADAERRERLVVQVAQAWSAKTAGEPPVDYQAPRKPNFDDKPTTFNIPVTRHDLDAD